MLPFLKEVIIYISHSTYPTSRKLSSRLWDTMIREEEMETNTMKNAHGVFRTIRVKPYDRKECLHRGALGHMLQGEVEP